MIKIHLRYFSDNFKKIVSKIVLANNKAINKWDVEKITDIAKAKNKHDSGQQNPWAGDTQMRFN